MCDMFHLRSPDLDLWEEFVPSSPHLYIISHIRSMQTNGKKGASVQVDGRVVTPARPQNPTHPAKDFVEGGGGEQKCERIV